MYSSNLNSEFPVIIIYFTKSRVLYKDKSFSKNTFNSILENFKKNPVYKNQAKLKNTYYLNGREIRNNQLLEELVKQNDPYSSSIIKEAELSLELEDLLYTGDSGYQNYQKIIQPKLNPFGLYIYTPKDGTVCSYIYPEKTINLFELNKINEGSAFCNSYNDLYISGSNDSNSKDFWIINNGNYEIKKKKMPSNKNNHSMIFLNFNKIDQWVFIIGGNDKKSFYYDLRKNYFINWGETNEIYTKPAFIQIGEYIYIFDSINYKKNYIERTKIINPERKWEKLNIKIDKRKISYFPSKFGLSYDSDGKILLLGGDNNKLNNTLVYEQSNNTFTLSEKGKNDNAILDDKTFYRINHKYSVGLPHNLKETKNICVIDKDNQSLIKINIEVPKDNNKTKGVSNLSFKEKPTFKSINTDKGKISIKTSNIEMKPSSYNKQQPYSPYGQCNNQLDNKSLLCDNCINKNRNTYICQCCHNPFTKYTPLNNAGMNENDNLRNIDNPTKENPRITIIQDEYYPLGSMNFQSCGGTGNKYYKKVYNKNYNRARDKAKVEIIYDEYTPIKVNYELNKQPIKKYTYVKKMEQVKKNEEDNKDKKNEEIKENTQKNNIQNDVQNEVKENPDLQTEDKDNKDNKDNNNENLENDVVEYKNNEQENKDDDLFNKSQNENENENENEEENQNEIIIEENHNNEDAEGLPENNLDKNGEEQEDNEENNKGQELNEGGNNIMSRNKEIIDGELPKDSLEIKDVVKDENNKETIENKDNGVIREGEEFHSMEEDNGEEQKNSIEHIGGNDNDNDDDNNNDNNGEMYENGNEIKFDGDIENENNGEENEEHNDNDNGNVIEGDEDENKIVQFDGEENVEEGEEEAMVFEVGGEEEMNYNYEEGDGEGEGEEGMNNEEGEEEMHYEGDNEEGGGSVVENDMGNENEEQNSVIEIGHDEDENGEGEGHNEGEGENGGEGEEMN